MRRGEALAIPACTSSGSFRGPSAIGLPSCTSRAFLSSRPTQYAELFEGGVPSYGWLQRYLKRHGFDTANDAGLEKSRAEWVTAENLRLYFDRVAEAFVSSGIFEEVEGWTWQQEYAVRLRVKPGNEVRV